MEVLLPSEIARLVLGYLQEQKCDEVAKRFLETSPHLQECKLVAQRGGRYSTKVGGLNLTDMLDKYCAANAIIQEKLNKVSDSEQIKNCNDIADQLRYLLEGSRNHRQFVVNINVPTQNSPNGSFGAPVLTTNSRKRQHSNSDRGKRVVKSLNSVLEKDSQTLTELNCDTVEATPLESLPGHKPLTKKLRVDNHTNVIIKKSPSTVTSAESVTEESKSNAVTSIDTQSDLNVMQNTHEDRSIETAQTINSAHTPSKSTEGTSTEQPMSYCSTEVQTAPLDLFDAEHDGNCEPIENLSILTEAIMHRPELAEQIAQNINKSIIPMTEYVQENPDANLSLLQGFDSAVKSAVETSDKTLEALFNEIFTVADTNQNEDSNDIYNQDINHGVSNENLEPMDADNNTLSMSPQLDQQTKRPEVPLKQRLRSSSRSQTNPDEDERDSNALLDNQNEEAIRSIVANALANKQSSSAENSPSATATAESFTLNNVQQPEYIIPEPEPPSTGNENIEPNKIANNKKPPKAKRNPRKPRTPKQKGPKSIDAQAEKIKMQEQNIMTMPTLILCSETDVQSSLPPMKLDGYLPIAPKPSASTQLTVLQDQPAEAPKIFLRTVNVPRHLVKPTQLEASAAANQFIMQLQASPQKSNATTTSCSGSPIVVITDTKHQQQQQRSTSKQQQQRGTTESITLYGDDSNSEVRVPAPIANMPIISLDESTCNLATGTGLPPFFKGNLDAETMTQDQSTLVNTKKNPSKTVNTKKLVEECKKTTTKAADKENEPEKQMKSKSRQENDEKTFKIEEGKKGNASEMTNPTIVITMPDKDVTVSPEKESNVSEKLVENVEPKINEKSIHVNKEKSIPEEKEIKIDDKIIPAKSKVDKQSIALEKEKKVEENEDSKLVKKTVAAKKNTQSENKSVSAKENSKIEENSVPAKKDSIIEEKLVPVKEDSKTDEKSVAVKKDTTTEEKPVPVRKDSKLEEKANNEITRRADIIITKRTPKSLLKDRSKNNRLSLSTPRRRNSHVRALDFDERTPEHDTSTRKIPQSCTRTKSSAVQGLFQSPPFSGETPPISLSEPIIEPKPLRTHVSVPPIATRSPAPKLQGNWNKATGIGMILGDSESSPEKSQTSLNLLTVTEEKEPPKSWDSDLRKIVGAVNEEDDERPKSAKKSRRRNSIKGKTIEVPKSAKKNTSKTPTREPLKITPPPATLKTKITVPMKTSPELMARFRDLQTPCKVETVNVPSTPRVMFATPGACLVKIGCGKEISIKDCVNTPDFPPTPCIHLTPKIVEEEEHEKKPSPYYEPSEDTTSKEIVSSDKIVLQQVTTTVTKSVTIQKKNVVELQESKTVEITKYGVIEENMAKNEVKEVESTSEDNSKEITEEESMGETNASADTTNTDSDSDSDSDSNSSTSSSSSNSSSSDSSSCSSNASSPTKSVNISHHDNSTTESEVDSPQKVPNESLQTKQEEVECPVEDSPKKESLSSPPPPPKVIVETSPQVQQLTSTISAIITNEEPIPKLSTKPKIINIQTISLPVGISRKELEEKRQRVMAKFKQTANAKRPVTVKRVNDMKKVEVKQPAVKKVIEQPSAKKIKPSPKKKVPEVTIEEVQPKNILENEKENPKNKVDQVKRDLFAPGDEAEQRTTRSQSARKSVDENPPLPGVLECLQLIPANKSVEESLDQTVEGLSTSQTNSLDISFVYDDSVPIKKRKRNYSSSELENEYAFTFPDEDEVRIMKVQPYQEIFSMTPKVMKKKSSKKSPIKAKRKVARCPLAASSPIKKDKSQKRKLSKRKASPIKEEKQVEKKVKVEEKSCLDPQALFKKIDVDKFLKAVHVSK